MKFLLDTEYSKVAKLLLAIMATSGAYKIWAFCISFRRQLLSIFCEKIFIKEI